MPELSQRSQHWPKDVGILAFEIYFPYLYVDQTELEVFDGVSQGKYTIGLGQGKMGFCSDCEDINSLCLTVVQKLMEKNNISYNSIGRLEVGTETIIDKSKSVKSVLMQLFESSGNFDVEGVDTTNACYGGTSALFNAVNWIESSSWDGRFALVVAGDIAVYASGNARPTGGAGAVAMLIGPNAPVFFEPGVRATHMMHAYDFYKPNMSSEYPVVDGKLSIQCYLSALDKCYALFKQKLLAKSLIGTDQPLNANSIASAFIFHSPYCKLVQKSVARLLLGDFLSTPSNELNSEAAGLEKFRSVRIEETYMDKDVEKAFVDASKTLYKQKTEPSLLVANQVGNMYTPSVYGGLASLLANKTPAELSGQRIVLFSYGSGFASSMYSLRVSGDISPDSSLVRLMSSMSGLKSQLNMRHKATPEEFEKIMKIREHTHHQAPYTPVGSLENLFPGTWYITHIDNMHRRSYARKPLVESSTYTNNGTTVVADTKSVAFNSESQSCEMQVKPVCIAVNNGCTSELISS